jgi:hypothetical protein
MRPSLFILRTTLVLSFALPLIPAASNAQLLFGGRPCTAGNGLYSCDFKDETGTQLFSASITLRVDQLTPTSLIPDSTSPEDFPQADLACACGLIGSLDNNKPLKKTNAVLCTDLGGSFSTDLALAGLISGNPTNPATHRFVGQLQNYNLSKGYLFDCNRTLTLP